MSKVRIMAKLYLEQIEKEQGRFTFQEELESVKLLKKIVEDEQKTDRVIINAFKEQIKKITSSNILGEK